MLKSISLKGLTGLDKLDEVLSAYEDQGYALASMTCIPMVDVQPNPLGAHMPPLQRQVYAGIATFRVGEHEGAAADFEAFGLALEQLARATPQPQLLRTA